MATLRVVEFLTSASASSTSNWINLDYRFAEGPVRVIWSTQQPVSGSVHIEAAPSVANVSAVAPTALVTVTTFTTAFKYEFTAPWPYIRVRKDAGTNGLNIIGVV